jgi:phage tail protein X
MGKDASTIRQEIERTRTQMGDTVEALAYKTDVSARVKENVNDRVEAAKGTIGNVMDSVKTALVGASENLSSTAADAGSSIGDAVGASSRSGAATLSQVRDSLNSTITQAGNGLAQAGNQLQSADVAGKARRAVGAVQENPVGLTIAALAVGFLTGSLIPVSDEERKRVGPLRDKIADQAQAATSDLIAAGKAVALEPVTSAAATAMDSARTHGKDVVDAAKDRVSEN